MVLQVLLFLFILALKQVILLLNIFSGAKGTMDVDTINFGVKILISNVEKDGKPSIEITECATSGDVAIAFGKDLG